MNKNRNRMSTLALVLIAAGGGAVFAQSSGEKGATLLPAGTMVRLSLLHHLNSKHSPAGSPVYLQTAEDVKVDGRAVIASGTLVEGEVSTAEKSRSVGRGGSLRVDMRSVKAIDGEDVMLLGQSETEGRDRGGATAGLVIAFGLPGLFAKGRMAYLEKGTPVVARVAGDHWIGRATVGADEGQHPTGPALRLKASLASPKYRLAIEKGGQLKPIALRIEPPDEQPLTNELLRSIVLVRADGAELPEPVAPVSYKTSASKRRSSCELRYNGWSVVRYCDEGPCELVFEGHTENGSTIEASATLDMTIKAKNRR